MEGIKFQYYPGNIHTKTPKGYITLDRFIELHKSPEQKLINIFSEIKKAASEGNEKLKAELKQNNLRYFTPCVQVDPNLNEKRRGYENIIRFTGLLVLDFDHITNAPEFKEYLFASYGCIMAAWLSPSRKGVKALVSIPIVQTVKEFKEYYFGIALEMDQYNGFDDSGQNSVLPLFQSYDPDLLYRTDYTIWTQKGIRENAFDYESSVKVKVKANPVKVDYSYKDRNRVIKITTSAINNITSSPGHTRLRSAAVVLGGFIASGYISEQEAQQLIFYLIENNQYMKKGIPGYKKTARWGIRQGQARSLQLKNN